MTKIRLFLNKTLEEKKEFEITGDDFHYLNNVMRCQIGSIILLFNEKNGEFESEVKAIDKRKLLIKITNRREYETIINNFELAFCPPKSQKLDLIIQKCTEIGVKRFVPVISDHTVNRKINLDRLNKIIKEAVEQSNQIHIPEIKEPINFDQYILNNKNIYFADIQSEINFYDLKINANENISILVGPEGDFSANEIKKLKESKNSSSFSLGPRILRSETAAIASLVLFNNLKN